MLAKKHLTLEEYSAWAEEYHEARYIISIFQHFSTDGPLAQSVERRADNAKVVSSRLTWTTKVFFFFHFFSLLFVTFSVIIFSLYTAFSRRTEIRL